MADTEITSPSAPFKRSLSRSIRRAPFYFFTTITFRHSVLKLSTIVHIFPQKTKGFLRVSSYSAGKTSTLKRTLTLKKKQLSTLKKYLRVLNSAHAKIDMNGTTLKCTVFGFPFYDLQHCQVIQFSVWLSSDFDWNHSVTKILVDLTWNSFTH